ncbi:MAG: transporter [bacterium]
MRSPGLLKKLFPILFLYLVFSLFLFFIREPASADSFYPNAGVDTTDEAPTVPFGCSQTILNYEWDELGDGDTIGFVVPAFKYGLSSRLDAGVQVPYAFGDSTKQLPDGFADLQMGFKYLWTPLAKNHLWVSTVIGLKPVTASSENGLGNGVCDFSFHFIASCDMPRWRHHLNFGYNLFGRMPSFSRNTVPYVKYKIDQKTSPVLVCSLEFYGQKSPNEEVFDSPFQTAFKTSWRLNSNLTFDAGIAFGLNPQSPLRRYLFGLTLEN